MSLLLYGFFVRFSQALTNCDTNKKFAECENGNFNTFLPKVAADQPTLTKLLQFVFGGLGFLAVLIITIAGIRYIISQGNPEQHKQAWKTILYASIGLGVVLLADALVTLTLRRV